MKSSSSSVEGGATKKDKPHSLPIPQSKSPLPPLLSATTTTGQGQSRRPPLPLRIPPSFNSTPPQPAALTRKHRKKKEGTKDPFSTYVPRFPPSQGRRKQIKRGFYYYLKGFCTTLCWAKKEEKCSIVFFSEKNNEITVGYLPSQEKMIN